MNKGDLGSTPGGISTIDLKSGSGMGMWTRISGKSWRLMRTSSCSLFCRRGQEGVQEGGRVGTSSLVP